MTENSSTPTWLLDSATSHDVTFDLNNLTLHMPYTGIVIDDGTGLLIMHYGSISLSHPFPNFNLKNILGVPTMYKNLIFISQFYTFNNVYIEFLPTTFHVKDLRTGAILSRGGLSMAYMNG